MLWHIYIWRKKRNTTKEKSNAKRLNIGIPVPTHGMYTGQTEQQTGQDIVSSQCLTSYQFKNVNIFVNSLNCSSQSTNQHSKNLL